MTEIRWAPLFEAAHRMEAEIAKEALEAQGFPAAIFHGDTSLFGYGYLSGKIEVCVPSERLEEARAWLAEYEDGELVEDVPDVEGEDEQEEDE